MTLFVRLTGEADTYSFNQKEEPIYEETAAYGHMGREPRVVSKHFVSKYEGERYVRVELFTWEKLDYVEILRSAFAL